MTQSTTPVTAPLLRRLAACFYDAFIFFAVLMLASALLIPFAGTEHQHQFHPVKLVYFVLVGYVFLGWFWTHGGQTLGMRAWRIRLVTHAGTGVDWQCAFWRYLVSLPLWLYVISLSLGALEKYPAVVLWPIAIIWIVIDQWPNNWRDRISHTKVIMSA